MECIASQRLETFTDMTKFRKMAWFSSFMELSFDKEVRPVLDTWLGDIARWTNSEKITVCRSTTGRKESNSVIAGSKEMQLTQNVKKMRRPVGLLDSVMVNAGFKPTSTSPWVSRLIPRKTVPFSMNCLLTFRTNCFTALKIASIAETRYPASSYSLGSKFSRASLILSSSLTPLSVLDFEHSRNQKPGSEY